MTPDELRDWRTRHGISQARLASALGVDVMTVSRYERGVLPISTVFRYAVKGLECGVKRHRGKVRL